MPLIHNEPQGGLSCIGSCLIYAGKYTGKYVNDFSSANLFNIGPKRTVSYEPVMTTANVGLDDSKLPRVVDKEEARMAFELAEFYLEKLVAISGGTTKLTYILGTPVTVTDPEIITLNGARPVRLANKSYNTSALIPCSEVVVTEDTDTTPTTYVKDTDYTVSIDVLGFTNITRIANGSIADGDSVRVTYGYTPSKADRMSRGGASIISPIVLRVIHVKRIEGDKIFGFMIDLYKVYFDKMSKIGFGQDENQKEVIGIPYEFVGEYDKNRVQLDQVDALVVLRGMTLADLNMDKMADLDLAVLKEAALYHE